MEVDKHNYYLTHAITMEVDKPLFSLAHAIAMELDKQFLHMPNLSHMGYFYGFISL